MARKPIPLTPWQEMEEQAYHAYREWPLFLKLRLRALRKHLPPAAFRQTTPADDASSTDASELLKEYGLITPKADSDI